MSQSPDNPSRSASILTASVNPTTVYSLEERRLLIRLAHEAIESALDGRDISLTPPSSHLAEQRGAFTTLYSRNELRGCVGYVLPFASLYRTVAETARAAAFDDRRFPPVRVAETPTLRVSLSVLSPLTPIHPDQVILGHHGLLVTLGARRGLLLPQVPIEHQWNLEAFLQQTCHKAGLPKDAWKHGATLEAFTTEIFSEPGTAELLL